MTPAAPAPRRPRWELPGTQSTAIARPRYSIAMRPSGPSRTCDGAARRRVPALPRQLQRTIAIPDDPVLADRARLFEPKDLIQVLL